MSKNTSKSKLQYFLNTNDIAIPSATKKNLSRIAFPLLAFISREQSLKLGLTPIDDERVIMALRYVKGRALDVGCGANNFIHSYGDGIGVDVSNWNGVDIVIEDAARLPFESGEFDTVSYLACLNHIPNRTDSLKDAVRVLKDDGQIIVTMITPTFGKFIHWLRFRNDPDHRIRDIAHDRELMGMSSSHVCAILNEAGFNNIKRKKFVYGLNAIYIAKR